MYASALERVAPPSILVDGAQHIVHLSPGASRFILGSGNASAARLPDVVRPELRRDVLFALEQALERKLPTLTIAEHVAFDTGPRRIAMHVLPVAGEAGAGDQALAVFLDAGPGTTEGTQETLAAAEAPVARQPVAPGPRDEGATLDDLRASNTELQSLIADLEGRLRSTANAHNDLRNLIASTDVGTLFLDTGLRIRMLTPPVSDLFDISEKDIGRIITDFTSHLSYATLESDARSVLHDLTPMEAEVQSRDHRWFIIRMRPYRTVEGQVDGLVMTFVDITSRRKIENDLRESQANYQTLFNSIDEGFSVIEMIFEGDLAVDYRFITVNSAFERQTGLSDAEGQNARTLVPDLEAHWPERYGRVATSGRAERFEAASDVMGRYFDVYAFPVGCPGQNRVGILFRDVSERKEAEQQRQMLTDELSHRVKNTLAVVQALARQPGSDKMTVQQYRDRFVGRIQALGHAHDELLQTHWRSADLESLARKSLSAYGGQGRRNLTIAGPDVLLTPKQGLGIALVLHELATNASKYGSLSVETGALSVTWEVQPSAVGQEVHLRWQESDGPPVRPGLSQGFGTRLIRQACSYELDGTVELSARSEGYFAQIRFPIG